MAEVPLCPETPRSVGPWMFYSLFDSKERCRHDSLCWQCNNRCLGLSSFACPFDPFFSVLRDYAQSLWNLFLQVSTLNVLLFLTNPSLKSYLKLLQLLCYRYYYTFKPWTVKELWSIFILWRFKLFSPQGKPVGTPDAGAYFRVLAEHEVAALFTSPTAIRAIRQQDPEAALGKQ